MSGKPYNLQKTLPFTTNEQDSKLSLKFPISREKMQKWQYLGKMPSGGNTDAAYKKGAFRSNDGQIPWEFGLPPFSPLLPPSPDHVQTLISPFIHLIFKVYKKNDYLTISSQPFQHPSRPCARLLALDP